ncbi:glycosyltransferase [Flavobacterium foetidum]|uniref:glycosyltransferase n=1 Tax=Flavobacterium foetidum TaxID=2026681 RepID=UPI001074ED72|nr:glycosyltransferase [Flavobacterium foetidum]KAF2514877.1 glycosyltransferase family 1 protein [Flavobacterium foetidum]
MLNNVKQISKNNNAIPVIEPHQAQYYDMIVFSHLRWKFVFQRPQHLIIRMAQNIKVLFVEEPLRNHQDDKQGTLTEINENLHILQPNVDHIEDIAVVLPAFVSNRNISLAWFYSPAFCPLLSVFQFDTIIYDCMDELTLFKGAPPQLIEQEKYLMANANIIFTGGKSLYESKKQLHSNVYCFPSSVDQEHFAKAQSNISVPVDIGDLPTPIVGYYGVIDERIDLELIAATANKLPDVSFVMIGPMAKIEESELPKSSNIYYLGMKCYNELPCYLKAFDVAMMPFALNDATKFISPTKTLEYMAAKKPIISTKITDVVRDYSECLNLVDNADEFVEAIRNFINKNTDNEWKEQYEEILERTSWDRTADQMKSIIKIFAR